MITSPTTCAVPAVAHDAKPRSTRRGVEALLLQLAHDGRQFELRHFQDGTAHLSPVELGDETLYSAASGLARLHTS